MDRLAPGTRAKVSLRKCLSLGGPGSLRGDGHPDDYLLWGNREFIRDTSNTKWVKLWVSWFDLQQELGSAPRSRGESWQQLNSAPGGESWLRRLDRQVKAINGDGLGVIVTIYQAFPLWSNGASGVDPVSREKGPEAKLPSDLSEAGPWGWFVGYLCARYKAGVAPNPVGPREPGREKVAGHDPRAGNPEGAWIDALEICNEPNLLLWPQEGIADAVIEMIRSAERISRSTGGPALLAPATSDIPDLDRRNERGLIATNWSRFTKEVLDGLVGFRSEIPVRWSQHNQLDVSDGRATRARQVAKALRLAGWRSDVAPLWLTEGGVNLYPHQDEPAARSRQARLIDRSFRRTMELPDVYMWTQHTISDKRGNKFKSGLRDDFHEGAGPGRARPAWSVWRDLPGSPVV